MLSKADNVARISAVRLSSNFSEYPFVLAITAEAPTPNNPKDLGDVLEQIEWNLIHSRGSDLVDNFRINRSW